MLFLLVVVVGNAVTTVSLVSLFVVCHSKKQMRRLIKKQNNHRYFELKNRLIIDTMYSDIS